MTGGEPIFPGGTGVSGLSVYPWAAEDGVCGGSPHLHLACTEAYVVVGGRGAVQTLTAAGLTETPLSAGTVVWFSPGTIHRAVNHDGALRIVVLMQNSGLPEAGDAVFAGVVDEASARARRDLAVRGFSNCRTTESTR
ncbi:MAG TPA: cupin domain-containing protein [Pseudonocardiaceae bacterium]|nr:cupin domain-containing protein [Pseudonocardiaceae bacterium]